MSVSVKQSWGMSEEEVKVSKEIFDKLKGQSVSRIEPILLQVQQWINEQKGKTVIV